MSGDDAKETVALAQRLSTTLPQYLVSLAHEPSVGLYFLCAHAQARAAPALASVTDHAKKRGSSIGTTSLDVEDAIATLQDGVVSAEKMLKSVLSELNEACELLSQNNVTVIY